MIKCKYVKVLVVFFVVDKFDFSIKELMYFEILDRRPGPSFDYELL
jgi:hypothetical protein